MAHDELKSAGDPAAARRKGARDAVGAPVLVLFASMMGFGSLAHESGLDVWTAIATTIAIWGLPGQMVMAEMTAAGAPLFAIAAGVAAANARFLPMTLSLTPLLSEWRGSWLKRLLFAQFVTLTPWVIALQRFPGMAHEDRVPYYAAFSAVCLAGATIGTALGFELAGELPRPLTLSLVFLSPAFFAMVFADVRHRAGVLALASGACLGPVLHGISPDWGIPVTGLLAGSLAFSADYLLRWRSARRSP